MKKALVAVSGGSDSLALLDMLKNEHKYALIVAHVNYHFRDSSDRDEKIVTSYCEKFGIQYHILHLDSKKEKDGNFEDWARVKRYKFFKQIYDEQECECLFVGHQKDDFIETYLIQQQRKAIVENYGLAKETILQDMNVVRPLLHYSKKELEEYCNIHNIEYGVDETNYDLSYSRNKIRHELVEKMSESEKNDLIEKVNKENLIKNDHVKMIKKLKEECLIKNNILDLKKFNNLSKGDQKEILYYFLIDNLYKKISIKLGRLLDILKKINSSKPNIELAIYDDMVLTKEYDLLVIKENVKGYCYSIGRDLIIASDSGYTIKKSGKKLERVIIEDNRFPLYLKNYDGSDKVVNRIFINKKIPVLERKKWPVIVDKFGVLLHVIGMKKIYNEVYDSNVNLIEFYICESKGE